MMSPTAHMMHLHRRVLCARMAPLGAPERVAIVEDACIEHGGSLIPADMPGDRNSHFAELSLLGLYHQGNSIEEAIANWMKAVARITLAETEDQAA